MLRLIAAQDLDRWSERVNARPMLPALLRMLVHATVERTDLTHVDFPAGDEAQRPGYDGTTTALKPNAFVPAGITYWEMGTDEDVKRKLNGDYDNRIGKRGEGDFSKVTYVAVTPRDYQNKTAWADEKKKLGQWADVRVLDSSSLEQWLEIAPAVALWLLRTIGTPPEGLCDVTSYWQNIRATLKKPLSPKAALVSRTDLLNGAKAWLAGAPSELAIRGQSPQEVLIALAAWVTSLPEAEQAPISSRAVIVDAANAWNALAMSKTGLILIQGERLALTPEMVGAATRHANHVLVTLPAISGAGGAVLKLERMDRSILADVLQEEGLSQQEALPLARQSGGAFSILRRRYSATAAVAIPAWGQGAEAGKLAPLLLAGSWNDGHAGDQAVVAKIANVEYRQVKGTVAQWAAQPDAPVRRSVDAWEFVSPLDAWAFLRPGVVPHLDAFEEAAIAVLGVDDPRLDLPIAERFQAPIRGKVLPYSQTLREGMAHTLALLGACFESDGVEDAIPLGTRVVRAVRGILPLNSSWRRWASLGRLLPVLAEAAPEAVLDAAESGLQGADPELPKLFSQEGDTFGGSPEHTGLLWALERLAWSPAYLSRSAKVLAMMAERDPGGKWANRPRASLREIFFSLMPSTMADLDARIRVIQALLADHPKAGWNLLLDILPERSGGILHSSATPEWRYWAEGWKCGVSGEEYAKAQHAVLQLAIEAARQNDALWADLIGKSRNFSRGGFEAIVDALGALDVAKLKPESRQTIWDALRDKAQRHRYFRDAKWAWPEDALKRIEALRDKFEPAGAVERAVPLFGHWHCLSHDKKLSFAVQEKQWRLRGVEALKQVLASDGLAGVIRLAHLVNNQLALGAALSDAADNIFDEVLPGMLCERDLILREFSAAYAAYSVSKKGRDWAEALPSPSWSAEQIGTFAAQMSLVPETWDFVAKKGVEVELEYWKRARAFTIDLPSRDVEFAARKLISVSRPYQAIDLLAVNIGHPGEVPADVQLELLETAMTTPSNEALSTMDGYSLQEVVSNLQKSQGVDESRLAKIEWALLPLLNRDEHQPETLHRLLARDPSFFVDFLKLLYRARNAPRKEEKPPETKQEEEAAAFRRRQAEQAWELLNEWHKVPGTREDGTVDAAALTAWLQSGRSLAKECDRLEVFDIAVGELFAYAPGEADGSWPCIPVRDALEKMDSVELLRGFKIGISNSRGVHWRNPKEGGRQERELAAKYDKLSATCREGWPQVGAALKRIADEYTIRARVEDERAESEK
jgi:hypothetical protein